jgi:hypothetical protein
MPISSPTIGMPYSLTYSIGGTVYTLSGYDATSGLTFGYGGDAGFGMAPLHRITQRGPMQQGDTDEDFRLDPRILQLPLIVRCDTLSAYYQSREKILNIFTPSNVAGELTVTRPDGAQRSILCKTLGGLTYDYSPSDGYAIRTVVQLRADDPTWYNPAPVTTVISPAVAGTPMAIPLVMPFTMGTSTINTTMSITYDGNWLSYPVITATGSITNLTITNNTTGLSIVVSGNIPAGRVWTFDLRYGYKTVYDDLGVNQISTITTASNLATFALVSAPTAVSGVNSISLSSTAVGSGATVQFTYYNRYIGI